MPSHSLVRIGLRRILLRRIPPQRPLMPLPWCTKAPRPLWATEPQSSRVLWPVAPQPPTLLCPLTEIGPKDFSRELVLRTPTSLT